jgi:hypothetical protein
MANWAGRLTARSLNMGRIRLDISPIIVGVAFPIAEIDLWLDMLNGDRKVYFVYICHGEASADGDTDIVLMSLTTEDVPGGDHHLATASSIHALYPHFH